MLSRREQDDINAFDDEDEHILWYSPEHKNREVVIFSPFSTCKFASLLAHASLLGFFN